MSFERKNLAYVVRHAPDKREQLIHILESVKGSAIVYARSRRRTKEYAELLTEAGISATFYHAGLDSAVKDERQRGWQQDKVRVMVATNAFGMGIDKPDVRLVIHIDCPDSIEAYFQEAGRAGRDGRKAYAVLLYNDADQRKLEKRIADTFPEKDYIRKVYEHLAGYIEYTEEQDNQARVMFTIGRDDLYRLENTSPNEEKVITAMLRNYGGLFTDYNFIDESFIAQQTQLEPQQVYLTLKGLSQRHILHFIPQKKTPYIRYTQRREDMEHVQIPPSVYEERKAQFEERIHAMINYAKDDAVCRSRQLLRYFGEESDHDCRQCDVCLSHRSEGLVSEPRMNEAMERILALLDDGQPHPLIELRDLQLPVDELDAALTYLLKEEYIRQSDGLLSRR